MAAAPSPPAPGRPPAGVAPGAAAGGLPPEAFFVAGAVSQYIGAAIAVELFEEIPAEGVAWLRILGAALILVAWRRPWRRRWTGPDLLLAGVFGVVLCTMNLTFYLAIDRLDLGTTVAIEFIGPIVVAAAGTRTRRNAAAVGLAAMGVVLLAEVQAEGSADGILLALAAAVMWAGYIVFGSRVARSGIAVDGLGIGMVIGAIVLAPLCTPSIGNAVDRPELMLLAMFTGLLSSVVPYALDQITLARLDPSRFALLLALLPVTAAIVGAVGLGQVPSATEAFGIALVVAGVAVRDRAAGRHPVPIPADG